MKRNRSFAVDGVGKYIVLIILLSGVWFIYRYGQRLNPFDGKTWDDFASIQNAK